MQAEQKMSDFDRQLKKADRHSSASWHREYEITQALRIAQQDENCEDEARGLQMLGKVYVERSMTADSSDELFDRLDDLILATALYNSSLVRLNENDDHKTIADLKSNLRQVERDFLKLCGARTVNNDNVHTNPYNPSDAAAFVFDVDRSHKKKLNEFRQECRNKLQSVQSAFTVFRSPLHNTDMESESRRAKEIEGLFSQIKLFTQEFVSTLLDECVEALGDPPVDFALIGFGSFARSEMTPFSDVECGILVNEGSDSPQVKEYFVKLTQYFNYKILNLRETILPSMCIPSLNDKNNRMESIKRHECATCSHIASDEATSTSREEPTIFRAPPNNAESNNDWFYDNEMRGFSVDGRMDKACKSPLGWLVQRSPTESCCEDLIKTPSDMAILYYNSLLTEQDDTNLSTVLANVSYLYGNEELLQEYDAIVLSLTELTEHVTTLSEDATMFGQDVSALPVHVTTLNARQKSAIGCLREALQLFKFSLSASDIGLISSVKQKLYRVVDMLLLNLGKLQYPGVVDNTPWNILDRLREDGVISGKAHHNLQVIAGIVNEVRLTTYLRCGRQDEVFSFFDQSTDIDNDLAKDFFVRFFYTVFPFQRAVDRFLQDHATSPSHHGSPYQTTPLQTTPLQTTFHQTTLLHLVFNQDETFYEYSHLKSAIALSLTAYRYLDQTLEKFAETLRSTTDEDTRRLCLAFLSCLHPDYSVRYCEQILATTRPQSNAADQGKAEWRMFSYLVGSLASFHRDDVTSVEAFLARANEELHHDRSAEVGTTRKTSQVIVSSYTTLIQGLIKFRHQDYTSAIVYFDEARTKYLSIPQSRENPQKAQSQLSLFVTACVFMKGRCYLESGDLDDPHMEMAMRSARAYTGNGHFMRILYHAYIGAVSVGGEQQDMVVPKHAEKALELYLRFRCPIGQERWVSIVAQGVILAALFLGMFYRQANRLDEAVRVFRMACARVVPKSLTYCSEEYHVGTIDIETVKTCIDAFRAVFKLLEAECLYSLRRHDEMWTCLSEALDVLAKYRGKFQHVNAKELFSFRTAQQSVARGVSNTEGPRVWQSPVSAPRQNLPAPRLIDHSNAMANTLEAWCDNLTMAMKYSLYTLERDMYGMILEKGGLILLMSIFLQTPNLPAEFQANPYKILNKVLPFIRHQANAHQMVDGIFQLANQQSNSAFEMIKKNMVECQYYAAEFTDEWIELLILYLRMSLCHDLVSASGLLQ